MNYEGAPGLEFGEGDAQVDAAVARLLPAECRILCTEEHGSSFWARTGRIDVSLKDGSVQPYFIKVMSRLRGKQMVEAEYESMKAIHSVTPDFAPAVVGWGTYESIPDTHFLLQEFRNMMLDLPDPDSFAVHLASLHQKSSSPNGKFGFHTTTYPGNLPQYTDWEESWETFFAKSMRFALDLEIKAKGYDAEFDELLPALFDRVIPRLLRPLESEGRIVKPSLVHGDLWFANAAVDGDSGDPLIFDACCFYAHNEYEFGQWRPVCNRFGSQHLEAYQTHLQKSPPEEDFDGRIDLYKLKFNTHVSALFYNEPTLREQMLGDLRDLKARYGDAAIDHEILE